MPLKICLLLCCGISVLCAVPIGVYLVPWDYNGPISSYYSEWGGTKPHATIAGFVNQRTNINQIVQFVANLSFKSGRWDFSCSKNKCYVQQSSSLQLMKFSAMTVSNISYYLKKMGVQKIHEPNPCHITLCKTSETSFPIDDAIDALEASRDWRLVIVEQNGSTYTWTNSYPV